MMLNARSSPTPLAAAPKACHEENPCDDPPSALLRSIQSSSDSSALSSTLDDDAIVEWDEKDIVLLHWRLLKEVADLRNPETPLEDKLDTLRWIFTEREKESRPFSFVNCLKVVGCSPLSPIPYFGLVDAEEIRDAIRNQVKRWLSATLDRYPCWVRDAVLGNPEWVENQLTKNPQWINEQVRKRAAQADLFA